MSHMTRSWIAHPPDLLVALLLDAASGPPVILHPDGVTRLDCPRTDGVQLAGVSSEDGHDLSWAWGFVAAEVSDPWVRFQRWHGLSRRRVPVRRLSASVWTAQVPGRWSAVSLIRSAAEVAPAGLGAGRVALTR